MPSSNMLTADDVPMQAKSQLKLFIKVCVVMAKADEYWLAEAVDKHLSGVVGVVWSL